MKIIWLDDERITISAELNQLKAHQGTQEVVHCRNIMQLMDYIMSNTLVEDDVFIIDVMLTNESFFYIKNQRVDINENAMAGITLYKEYLKDNYPNNLIIFYTVTIEKENDAVYKMYQRNMHETYPDDDFEQLELHFIGKPEMNSRFKKLLIDKGIEW